MKRFSVITVNLNNRDGLNKTIASVVAQTFRNYEFIIVDGGSKDGSVDLVRSHGDAVTSFVTEKDTGIFNAQNKGIGLSSGEYLLFLNSGDFLCQPSVLQEVHDKIKGEDIVYGDMRIHWGGGNITHGKSPETVTVEHMFVDTLWHPVSFIRRELFAKYGGYDETFRMVADYEFFFRAIVRHNVLTRHIPVEICEYQADGFSSQAKYKKLERLERRRVQQRYLSEAEIRKLATLQRRARLRGWLRRIFG